MLFFAESLTSSNQPTAANDNSYLRLVCNNATTYTHDNVGNRTDDKRRVSSVVVDELVYTNEPGQRFSNIYDSATTTHHAITINNNGSITGISPAFASNTIDTLTYNNAGRLSAVKNGSTTLGSYVYDAFGLRRVKTLASSGRLFVYGLNGELLAETDASGTPISDYIYVDGRLVAVWTPSTSLLASVQTDRMMIPNVASNGSGTVTWSAEFEPFGKTRNLTASDTTINIRLAGQYYDPESGYYYNGFRTYNPEWGRYLEEDPIGLAGGMNIRSYVDNMPTAFVDSMGLFTQTYNDYAHNIGIYDSMGNHVGTFPASNNAASNSNGSWPAGTFPYDRSTTHANDAPNSEYGSYGNDIYDVPGRTNMGTHSGREGRRDAAGRSGYQHATMGCIRTTDAAKEIMEMLKNSGDMPESVTVVRQTPETAQTMMPLPPIYPSTPVSPASYYPTMLPLPQQYLPY